MKILRKNIVWFLVQYPHLSRSRPRRCSFHYIVSAANPFSKQRLGRRSQVPELQLKAHFGTALQHPAFIRVCGRITWLVKTSHEVQRAEPRSKFCLFLPAAFCFQAQMKDKWNKDASDKDLRNRRHQKHHSLWGFFSFFCTSVELKGDVSRGEERQRGLLWHQSSSVPFHGRKEEKDSEFHVWGASTQTQI